LKLRFSKTQNRLVRESKTDNIGFGLSFGSSVFNRENRWKSTAGELDEGTSPPSTHPCPKSTAATLRCQAHDALPLSCRLVEHIRCPRSSAIRPSAYPGSAVAPRRRRWPAVAWRCNCGAVAGAGDRQDSDLHPNLASRRRRYEVPPPRLQYRDKVDNEWCWCVVACGTWPTGGWAILGLV
jgi:hypothetical protein